MSNELTVAKYIQNPNVSSRITELLKGKASQFTTSLIAAANNDSKLAECDPVTVVNAALIAAAMDLPVNNNLGYVYLIPYKDNKTGTSYCQLQFGYKGYVQLAMRSGQFKTLNVTDVREGEILSNDLLTGDIKFEWKTDREKLKIVGYVAYMELVNGFEKMLYMTSEQMNLHGKKYSQTFKKGYGKWTEEFDAMSKKTVLKLLLSKYAPMTIDMQKAQLADQSIVTDNDYVYVDNEKMEAHDVANQKERERILAHIQGSKSLGDLCKVAHLVGEYNLSDDYEEKMDGFHGIYAGDYEDIINETLK
jgi:recombination protein RecT